MARVPRERQLPSRAVGPAWLPSPSSRRLRALRRVRGRAARSGGRAGRARWSPVTGRWQESGHSRCCGPWNGLLAPLPLAFGCCSLLAPTLARDFAHAATAHEVRGWDGPVGWTGRVVCSMLCALCCCVLSHDGFVPRRVVLCAMLWSIRSLCRVICRVLACGGGASRACRVLGACAAARRSRDGPPCVSTWT